MPTSPTVTGLLEAAMYVGDVPRGVAFYRDVLGFDVELANDLIGVMRVPDGRALILFARAIADQPALTPPNAVDGTIPPHGGAGRMHVGFSIAADALDAWRERLASHGVTLAGVVRWKRGGTSLYFRDPDEHLVELISPGLWSFY